MSAICFFNSVKTWGGGEKWHLEVSQYMYNQGHDVLVITNAHSELYNRLQNTGIKCIGVRIEKLSFLNPFKIKQVAKILKQNNVETILINLSNDLKLAGLASKKLGVKRIIYGRGIPVPIKNSFLNRYLFGNIVTDILANSEATKRSILQNNSFLFPEEKIKVIYNPVYSDVIVSRQVKPLYKKTDRREIVLTTLGRLEFEKNHSFLIYLAVALKKRNINFKILIAGEGSLKNKLIALSKSLDVENEVHFLGYVENYISVIESGDIFVLPSLWEGFGYVLAEASLCKKPIIAFDTSSIPELVLDGKSGYIVKLNDIEAFADKVVYLATNEKVRKSMSSEGFNYSFKTFDSKLILTKMEAFLIQPN